MSMPPSDKRREWNRFGRSGPKSPPRSPPARRVITVQYPSTCPVCQKPIEAGESVMWMPGRSAIHVDCAAKSVLPIPPA